MDLKPLKEYQKKKIGEMIGEHLRLGWTFDKWYEKLILIALCLLGTWKFFGFFT